MNYLIIVLFSYSLGFLNEKGILMREQLPLISLDINDDYTWLNPASMFPSSSKKKR